ncbi:FHA domain-containing protein [Tessaracoccus sp. OH4464_COT-324]|uniref:FHA domain-containing protein n=1 Tax=Tessaracoccus sp. OH4464_COT-324 TaxID=2491059 RepID=UPI000F63F972|nr:FHA domain-containing protein [Tessaracoccus sp. OH4464_COT-324]
MKCLKCGFDCAETARFCSHCGAQLETLTDTTTNLPIIDDLEYTRPRHTEVIPGLAPGNAMLMVRLGHGDESRFLIDADVTTVGRHPESDIFLDDITVSRHHAKFIRIDGVLFLEDLGSLNGTYINRTLIDGRAIVRDGDEVQIGKYRATVAVGDARGS